MTTLQDYTIGFIGLGLMGRPMCLNLHRAGAHMIVYNRSPEAMKSITRDGIEPATSLADVARRCNIIVLMVSDTPAVANVLFGEDGMAGHLQSGSLIIDMGTTAVAASRDYAHRLAEHGVDYIDAPVSGGEIGAINGSLTIMAGGKDKVIALARPLFKVMGSAFSHIGEIGAGQVAKAANQIIVGLNIGAVAEALALVKHAGVDAAKVREALMNGFAASRILEVHGQRMIDNNFTPGAKATTQYKDLKQAVDLGAAYNLDLPATRLNMSLYETLIDNGGGNLDHSALFTLMEHPKK